MQERTIEDRLREEYFDLLPEIRRVAWQLETEIRFHTLSILHGLEHYQQLLIKSRVKDCESALSTLRRKQEGKVFDPERPEAYSILHLPDLAGVRLLVFPGSKFQEADDSLRAHFHSWTACPVENKSSGFLASRYKGYCKGVSEKIQAEYQVVPMLLGLFWEVEHSAVYKPAPHLRGIANSRPMTALRTEVERSLARFESEFERLVMAKISPPSETQ